MQNSFSSQDLTPEEEAEENTLLEMMADMFLEGYLREKAMARQNSIKVE